MRSEFVTRHQVCSLSAGRRDRTIGLHFWRDGNLVCSADRRIESRRDCNIIDDDLSWSSSSKTPKTDRFGQVDDRSLLCYPDKDHVHRSDLDLDLDLGVLEGDRLFLYLGGLLLLLLLSR